MQLEILAAEWKEKIVEIVAADGEEKSRNLRAG